MDKEQAIEKLNDIRCHVKETSAEEQALVMAIDALKQPVVTDTNVGDKISKFIDGLEEIFADLRERHVDDSVCGLCEYDGAYMGQSGDWCNECPGFERDDCFELSDKTRKEWTEEIIKALPTVQPEPQWISVTERLPDNADHPGAFCPRYQVVTPYGVTEGWYRPHDHEKGGQWFALFWFMSQIYEIWNIDFERGDVPKVIGEAPVMEWRPLPEPYKPNK